MVKKGLNATVLFFCIIGALLSIVLYTFNKLDEDMCCNEIIEQIVSPDKNNKLVIFQRDCGATTGFSTQISIIEVNQILKNEGGNIFIADTNHGAAPSGPGGGPKVIANWDNNNQITIKYHANARIFKELKKAHGINIKTKKYH